MCDADGGYSGVMYDARRLISTLFIEIMDLGVDCKVM